MGIVDDLLAHPGVYLGINRDVESGGASAARLVVTPLPGGAGVSLDYETFNTDKPDTIRGHAEHSLLARTHDGGTILVAGHIHADSVALLREADPGIFEMVPEGSPFPVRIKISMPEPGRLLHTWCYGRPGEEAIERDTAELTLTQ